MAKPRAREPLPACRTRKQQNASQKPKLKQHVRSAITTPRHGRPASCCESNQQRAVAHIEVCPIRMYRAWSAANVGKLFRQSLNRGSCLGRHPVVVAARLVESHKIGFHKRALSVATALWGLLTILGRVARLRMRLIMAAAARRMDRSREVSARDSTATGMVRAATKRRVSRDEQGHQCACYWLHDRRMLGDGLLLLQFIFPLLPGSVNSSCTRATRYRVANPLICGLFS
jgi:hypothetical protein